MRSGKNVRKEMMDVSKLKLKLRKKMTMKWTKKPE
jgi:hypothetical protein